MEGEAIAEVMQSRSDEFREGDIVRAMVGGVVTLRLMPRMRVKFETENVSVTAYLGVLGMPGFTAYVGLKVIGQPKPGETLAVSAATGPVGSLVGQLAKRAGTRTIGIAGEPRNATI